MQAFRVRCPRFCSESGYDYMRMYDGNGVMVNDEDGCGANDATRRVRYLSPSNRMTIRFTSDYTVTKAGFRCTVTTGNTSILVCNQFMSHNTCIIRICHVRNMMICISFQQHLPAV